MLVKEFSKLIFLILKASMSNSKLRVGNVISLWSPLNSYEVKCVTIEKDLVKIEVEQDSETKLIDVVAYTDFLSFDDLVRVIDRDNVLWEGEAIELWKKVPEALVHRKIKNTSYENRYSKGVTVNIYIV